MPCMATILFVIYFGLVAYVLGVKQASYIGNRQPKLEQTGDGLFWLALAIGVVLVAVYGG